MQLLCDRVAELMPHLGVVARVLGENFGYPQQRLSERLYAELGPSLHAFLDVLSQVVRGCNLQSLPRHLSARYFKGKASKPIAARTS